MPSESLTEPWEAAASDAVQSLHSLGIQPLSMAQHRDHRHQPMLGSMEEKSRGTSVQRRDLTSPPGMGIPGLQ